MKKVLSEKYHAKIWEDIQQAMFEVDCFIDRFPSFSIEDKFNVKMLQHNYLRIIGNLMENMKKYDYENKNTED